jgi:hypothetical protein
MATFWIIMKLTWNYLLVALLLNVTGLLATAQEEAQIPDTAWEHPEGVAFALMLTKGIGNDAQSIYLKLYVKNISNSPESLVTQSRGASAIFFYLDSSGRPVTLGNHDHPDQPWKDEIESNPRWRIILPGKMMLTGTDVTAAEVALIKTHTVKCKILLIDPATQKQTAIVGSPQLLNPQSL